MINPILALYQETTFFSGYHIIGGKVVSNFQPVLSRDTLSSNETCYPILSDGWLNLDLSTCSVHLIETKLYWTIQNLLFRSQSTHGQRFREASNDINFARFTSRLFMNFSCIMNNSSVLMSKWGSLHDKKNRIKKFFLKKNVVKSLMNGCKEVRGI